LIFITSSPCGLEEARGDAHPLGDVFEWLQGRAAGDLQVAREIHGVLFSWELGLDTG
jgi:hypothetical protein